MCFVCLSDLVWFSAGSYDIWDVFGVVESGLFGLRPVEHVCVRVCLLCVLICACFCGWVCMCLFLYVHVYVSVCVFTCNFVCVFYVCVCLRVRVF